jgi:hypothetical protein
MLAQVREVDRGLPYPGQKTSRFGLLSALRAGTKVAYINRLSVKFAKGT